MTSERVFFALGSFLAGTAVAAGAFGAHALKGRIAPELLDAFSTGARYQMFHALALLALAWAVTRCSSTGSGSTSSSIDSSFSAVAATEIAPRCDNAPLME